MGHTPYGYRIENGHAVIDEQASEKIRNLYKYYLEGLSLSNAAKEAGLETYHGTAKNIMANKHYLGDEFYPAIIDQETFDAASLEFQNRATRLGRNNHSKAEPTMVIPTKFALGAITEYFEDPVKQAEYMYSLIEREEKNNGKCNDNPG